jgi:dual specificity phosphatase 12
MDKIVPNLWIGDLSSALDVPNLKANKICSVLSAMRGTLRIHQVRFFHRVLLVPLLAHITVEQTFLRHQIMLDDTEGSDVLVHLLPAIGFIEKEIEKDRGVLVHCQAGISAFCLSKYGVTDRSMLLA